MNKRLVSGVIAAGVVVGAFWLSQGTAYARVANAGATVIACATAVALIYRNVTS